MAVKKKPVFGASDEKKRKETELKRKTTGNESQLAKIGEENEEFQSDQGDEDFNNSKSKRKINLGYTDSGSPFPDEKTVPLLDGTSKSPPTTSI